MSTQAFTKTGNTVVFTAATTAPSPVQAVSSTLGGSNYRIINSGSVTVFLGYGTTASDATNNSPVITTTGTAIPLLPGTDEILRLCLTLTLRELLPVVLPLCTFFPETGCNHVKDS